MVTVDDAFDDFDRDMQQIEQDFDRSVEEWSDQDIEEMGEVLEEGGFNDWADCINELSPSEMTDAAIAECDRHMEGL